MDRRIKKNRQGMMKALMELLKKKDLEQITINEIVEEADVNRSTFYLHFTDKYDLLKQCVETACQCVPTAVPIRPEEGVVKSLDAMLQYMEQHSIMYITLLKSEGSPLFHGNMMKKLCLYFEPFFEVSFPQNLLQKKIWLLFVCSATVGVIEWWLMNDLPCSAQELMQQLMTLLAFYQIES